MGRSGRAAAGASRCPRSPSVLVLIVVAVLRHGSRHGRDLGALRDLRARLRVAPISLWLIWRMRDRLRVLEPRPSWLALPLIAAAGFGWLLGDVGAVNAVSQFAIRLDAGARRPGGPGNPRHPRDAVPAGLPVLLGADRRVPAADADGAHGRLHDRRGARVGGARPARRPAGVLGSERPLVGRRGLQRGALPDRLAGRRDAVRLPELRDDVATLRVRRRLDRCADRRKLGPRLHHRHARLPVGQQDRDRRRPHHLRVAVLRPGDADDVLDRFALAAARATALPRAAACGNGGGHRVPTRPAI